MSQLPDPMDHRQADYPIDPLFLKRWSPRAMTGESLTKEELHTLFEAARWAPSSYNEQEWRFLYAERDSEHWNTFFNLLVEGNQSWCDQAAVLVVVISRTTFMRNNNPNVVHSFDAGAAFENLALQGTKMGLVVHGMAGFHQSKTRLSLAIPEVYHIDAMIAIGKPGDPDKLPENLRSAEMSPTGRKKISEIICSGPFAFESK